MKIDLEDLELLVYTQSTNKWKHIESILVSSDHESGGAYRILIIQNKLDNKFYSIEYCDWDIDNNDLINYTDTDLVEVFPKQITKTIYVTKNEL